MLNTILTLALVVCFVLGHLKIDIRSLSEQTKSFSFSRWKQNAFLVGIYLQMQNAAC